jgi:hypothetical protein
MTVTLAAHEIRSLTGFEQPTRQLQVLHKRGFHRAYIGRFGVVLERVHYEAICRGHVDKPVAKAANLSIFRGSK